MQTRFRGTAAMIAAAMMLMGGAAQGADKIKLGLGGFFNAYSAAMNGGALKPVTGIGVLDYAMATPGLGTGISDDSEQLAYFTPRMSGFQLGISYTPENCEETRMSCGGTNAAAQAANTAGQRSKTIAMDANYNRSIGGIDMSLHAGIGKGDLDLAATRAGDQDQWDLGVKLGFAGLTFGADYREDNQGTSAPNTDRIDYSLGVAYATGPWTIGAAYAHGEVEAGTGLGLDETDGYQVGLIYSLGPGITMTGGITYWDVADNLNAIGIEITSTEFIFGTLLSF